MYDYNPIPWILLLVAGIYAMNAIWVSRFEYECGSCGVVFTPNILAVVFTLPTRHGRYFTCPICGHRTVCTPIPKSDNH